MQQQQQVFVLWKYCNKQQLAHDSISRCGYTSTSNNLKHTILQASYNFQERISGINAEHFQRLDNIPITQSTVKAHKTSHSIFNDNFRGG